jgi:hypothetical protein
MLQADKGIFLVLVLVQTFTVVHMMLERNGESFVCGRMTLCIRGFQSDCHPNGFSADTIVAFLDNLTAISATKNYCIQLIS